MDYTTEFFGGYINAAVKADTTELPLDSDSKADLLSLLATDGSYTYASIMSEDTYEVVKVRADGGLILMDRGVAGTSAVAHRLGSCIKLLSPLVLAAIQDVVCNYDCCADGSCECIPLSLADYNLNNGYYYGKPWTGWASFNGDVPATLAVSNQPSWMTVTQVVRNNMVYLNFSGTPDTKVDFTFTISGSNCGGTKVFSTQLSLPYLS